MHVLPRATACVAVIAAAGIVAACSSSGSAKSDNTGATTPATTPASTSAAPSTTQQATTSAASGQLSKAEFVAQANAVCGSVNAKVQKLPAPSGPTDYPATIAYTRTVLDLFPPFSKQTKALVARSADKDELTAKWISLDQSDFAAQKPLLTQLLAAAQAKQSAKVEQLYSALDKTPDHSQAEATYLNSYGLTECAKLQEG
ncbi:MAG TPA: hypothetical protein VE074_15330 [Jatrophihabitantaceae bacterium]|nr:hypothetical protein [Jatrophihabitantaceae bacterium]